MKQVLKRIPLLAVPCPWEILSYRYLDKHDTLALKKLKIIHVCYFFSIPKSAWRQSNGHFNLKFLLDFDRKKIATDKMFLRKRDCRIVESIV